MIQFKPLTFHDYDLYQSYYKKANYEGYQTNFHSLMLWNRAYQTQFYYNEHYLVTLMHYEDFYFFNVPLTTKEYFKEAINDILAYCDANQLPFLMDGILEEQETFLKEAYPNLFFFQHDEGSQSYIYEANPHKTLSGKKMQKRRNHFNAFIKENENNFTYRLVTKDDRDEIEALFDAWQENKTDRYAIDYEKEGVLSILSQMPCLDYKMACIEVNGKIEAFILGSMLNHNTVQIHVEKANNNIRGLYVAIFKYFLENEYDEVLYVNREEDMGIESLRKAKQQLHPCKLLDQSFAFRKTLPVVSKATKEDMSALKERWLFTFKEDDEAFYDDYIKNNTLHIYLSKVDHRIVSVVYLREMNLNTNQQAFYIEGVSTHHLYHHHGYMKQLLSKVIEEYKDKILFIQAYHWHVYNAFKFDGIIYKNIAYLMEPLETRSHLPISYGLNKDLFKRLYQAYASNYETFIQRDVPADLNSYEAIYNDEAYALYAKFNDIYVVTEIIYTSKEAAYCLLNELISKYQEIKVICEKDFLEGEEIIFGKYYKSQLNTSSLYFNEYI